MKIRMSMVVSVNVGSVAELDEAVSLATDILLRGFNKGGVEIISIGREGASDKMTMKEFLSNCAACGGNWTQMVASGVKHLWPAEFEALPAEFDFKQIMGVVKKYVDIDSDQEKA